MSLWSRSVCNLLAKTRQSPGASYRILMMGHYLEWYANNNTIIIQSLFVLISFIVCFFIFRIFLNGKKIGENPDATDETVSLEDRVNHILQSQTTKTNANFSDQVIATESAEHIEKLQSELFNLKQTLKEKESITANSISESTDSAAYLKEIEGLKIRLSDYEVIAEDIADLQQLRIENQSLKTKLQSVQSKENISEPVTEQEKDLMQQFEKIKGT